MYVCPSFPVRILFAFDWCGEGHRWRGTEVLHGPEASYNDALNERIQCDGVWEGVVIAVNWNHPWKCEAATWYKV